MDKENEYVRDKYFFNSISIGYDFEKYLKGLFEGLGYDVEITTASNDQGGDLLSED